MGKILAFIAAMFTLFNSIGGRSLPESRVEKVHVHSPGVLITVREPTCSKIGQSEVRCIECGEILEQEAIPEYEHTFSGYVLIQEASLDTDEIYRDYCTVCGEVRNETVKTYEQKLGEEQAVRGNLGRLLIPDVEIDVALFSAYSNAQQIVDNYDSAAYLDWDDKPDVMIADHDFQGFTMIRYVDIGSTEAYIVSSNGTRTFCCVDLIPNAINTSTDLVYPDMTSVFDAYTGKYFMYTCNGDGRSVTITVWEEVF